MAEKKTLKIAHLPITDHLVLGVAKDMEEKGSVVMENCTIETIKKTGWNEIGDALRKKEVDGAFILAPFAMELFISGADIKLVLLGHKNGSILATSNSGGVKTLGDFKGKIVVFPYQLSIHTLLFHKLLKAKGLEMGPGKDVQIEVMAPGQIPQAVEWDEEGELAGFIVAEPFGSQVEKMGIGKIMALSKDIWPNHPCCVLVMRESALADSAATQDFINTLVKAGQFIHDNPHEAAVIGVPFLGQDVDVVEKVLTEPADRITTHELMPVLDDLKKIQSYFQENLGKLATPIDYDKFVDTSFAQVAGAK